MPYKLNKKSIGQAGHPSGYLMTNFDIKDLPRYQKRLEIFNQACPDSPVKFKIVTDAYDCDGRLCSEMQALVCNPVNAVFDNRMMLFFDKYNQIRREFG